MGKGGRSKGARQGQPRVKTAQAPKTRKRVSITRVTGKLLEWRGTFGWIKPTTPIQHPEASRHGGKVYLGQEDVEEEIAGVGTMVSFFAYADGSGLGAMHCKPAKGSIAQKQVKKAPQGAAKAQTKFSAKGSSKGAAQKAGDKEPKEQPPPDRTKRETVSSSLVSGTVTRVRGKVAFIKPEDKIDHPEAEKRKGEIYLHFDDVESGDNPLPGAQVIFFVYADDMGLGAEHCQVIEQGSGKPPADAAEAKKKAPKQKARPEKTNTSTKKTKPAAGKFTSNVKKELQDAKEKGPSGPDLPRERVTTVPIVGEVVAWKKKFGWIKPSEPVEHAASEKHDGRIYIHNKDVQEGTEMEVGSIVSFHVYSDASGLGAEECMAS